MKIALQSILLFIAASINAQVWLSEGFETSNFPPEGWTINEHYENWKYTASNYAGGTTGEATFKTLPMFEGTTRLISPAIDISASENLSLYFKYTLRLYQGGLTIGVATRTGTGDWISVWETNGTTTEKAEVDIPVENQGSAGNFQFCLYYTGESAKIKFWAIDDIILYDKKPDDVAAKTIITEPYFEPEDSYTPVAKVFNNGLNTETFDVVCNIYDTGDNLLYTSTQTVDTLVPGQYREVSFDAYTLPSAPDEAYHIVVITELNEDMIPGNDSTGAYIYTYVSYTHDIVVVEIGTATWCSACPYAAEAADSIVKNGYNLAVIEYHTDDDYSSTETDNRVLDYYSMFGFPTAFFDGVDEQVGAGPYFYSNYFTHYYFRSIEKTGVSLSLTSEQTKEGYDIKVHVSKLAPAFNKNAVVHLIVTESHIPENWQDEDELNFVCRLMLPDENGTSVNLALNDEITLDYLIETDPVWNYDELEVVAFIQDNDSHEILNATKASLAELIGIEENGNSGRMKLTGLPNPFQNQTTIQFELPFGMEVDLQVCDISGKPVAKLMNKRMESGINSAVWIPESGLPAGVYFAKLMSGQYIEIIKIIKTK